MNMDMNVHIDANGLAKERKTLSFGDAASPNRNALEINTSVVLCEEDIRSRLWREGELVISGYGEHGLDGH